MINNIIEIWYWTFMLVALAGFVIYSVFSIVRYLLDTLKKRLAGVKPDDIDTRYFKEKIVKQYSRRMIIVHWLTVALVIVTWYLGDVLPDARNGGSATLTGYLTHVLAGFAVLFLTVLRWTYRGLDGVPPIGESLLDMMARGVHFGLYLLLVLLSITGFMTALTSSVALALLTFDASLLPTEYTGPGVIPHATHAVLVTMLIVAVGVHILGAIKEQLFPRDGVRGRMWLRRKG